MTMPLTATYPDGDTEPVCYGCADRVDPDAEVTPDPHPGDCVFCVLDADADADELDEMDLGEARDDFAARFVRRLAHRGLALLLTAAAWAPTGADATPTPDPMRPYMCTVDRVEGTGPGAVMVVEVPVVDADRRPTGEHVFRDVPCGPDGCKPDAEGTRYLCRGAVR